MAKHKPLDTTTKRAEIMPPQESRNSVILNGAGNGAMVGSVPFIILELFAKINKTEMSPLMVIGSAIATVTGCSIGALFGVKEADRLEQYRLALGEQLTQVRAKVDENTATIDRWTKKLEAHEKPADEVTRS